MFFKQKICQVCLEKDKRIEDLSKQVELLHSLALPKKETLSVFTTSLEANKLLDGSSDQVQIPLTLEQQKINEEAYQLLSGSY